jgi:hypothetical protein
MDMTSGQVPDISAEAAAQMREGQGEGMAAVEAAPSAEAAHAHSKEHGTGTAVLEQQASAAAAHTPQQEQGRAKAGVEADARPEAADKAQQGHGDGAAGTQACSTAAQDVTPQHLPTHSKAYASSEAAAAECSAPAPREATGEEDKLASSEAANVWHAPASHGGSDQQGTAVQELGGPTVHQVSGMEGSATQDEQQGGGGQAQDPAESWGPGYQMYGSPQDVPNSALVVGVGLFLDTLWSMQVNDPSLFLQAIHWHMMHANITEVACKMLK